MKTKHKALLLSLCAVLLVASTIFGTFAYLQDAEMAKNTFTVGKVGITLAETDVDEDGNTKANAYHLQPGMKYTKDPTVTVDAGSEECYVRMMVTVSDMNKLKAAFPKADYYGANDLFLLQKLVGGWDKNTWSCVGYENGTNNSGTYEFRYNGTVAKSEGATELPALFTSVIIPGEIDNTHLANLEDVTIQVEAHAMQAAGFETADAAWAQFKK